jgi:hypothetical protein
MPLCGRTPDHAAGRLSILAAREPFQSPCPPETLPAGDRSPSYGAQVRKLGFRSRREIGLAVRWTFTTTAGWWFLAARLIAIVVAFWVMGRYGDTAALSTLVIAIVVVGLVAPPAPDDVGRR